MTNLKILSIGFILLVVFAGMMVPTQAAINSTLGQYLKNPVLAAWISFLGGAIFLTLLVLVYYSQLPN